MSRFAVCLICLFSHVLSLIQSCESPRKCCDDGYETEVRILVGEPQFIIMPDKKTYLEALNACTTLETDLVTYDRHYQQENRGSWFNHLRDIFQQVLEKEEYICEFWVVDGWPKNTIVKNCGCDREIRRDYKNSKDDCEVWMVDWTPGRSKNSIKSGNCSEPKRFICQKPI